jgi:quercetin dioxygenase-like cupin family protein
LRPRRISSRPAFLGVEPAIAKIRATGARRWANVSSKIKSWSNPDPQSIILKTPTQNRKELNMEIKRAGSQPSNPGPADWFTGRVRIDPLAQAAPPARVAAASVTFEPGARTAWHTHPLGQTLIVISGFGWAQRDGGPVEEIRPGDVIWFPPGEKHWHGASPTTALTHIAIQESLDGQAVQWLEKVSDDQYRKG